MRKLIEQLKAELEKAQSQNGRFRTVIKKLKEELLKSNNLSLMGLSKDGKVSEQHQAMQNSKRNVPKCGRRLVAHNLNDYI